jgi:hypothetical protein
MATKPNSKLIGGFVIGAIALVIVGMLAFGGGEFLKPKAKFILFFQGSLSGLDVGSPVTFRGIEMSARHRHRHQVRRSQAGVADSDSYRARGRENSNRRGERNQTKNDALIARAFERN